MIFDQIKSAVEFASHLPRYREIVGILWKYGFADVLKLVALQRVLGMEDATITIHEDGLLSKPLPERMRLALEELGPTFIKFGQIVSSRRDLVTDEYYVELCKLQAEVPAFPAREARSIIARELGHPVAQLFAQFDDVPVGSASIAQVHAAVLPDGKMVAVKVQRPDIEKVITLDLAILCDLARFVERHVPEMAALNPVGVVEEFSATLIKELDFSNEMKNAERFAQQFEGNVWIKVPAVFPELSSGRVLTMEFMTGCRVDDDAALKRADVDPVELSEHITEIIYEQIFEHGFFHGDPHPGNVLILPGGITCLMDFGMMGSFTPAFRTSVAHLIAGLAEKNHQQVMRSILDMSEEGFSADTTKMLSDVEEFSGTHLNQPLRDIKLGVVLNKLLELLRNNHLRMKGSFYLGIKALTQVEAIGRSLNPDLNFIVLGEPYAMKLIQGKYHPQRLFMVFRKLFSESIDFLEDFPHDFRNLYQRVKHGKISIPLEHKIDPEGFEPLRKTLDSIANRLTNAILTASVLICSSILILSGLPPKLGSVPILGLIGLIWGGYMCLRLVLSIWKHGGL
ncbi:MAG TPA: AarF/ABC1/UbiB kinase family protein [Terrimicrobiaceae bacterium]|nr:AarF/ABC1/UbiB kinase family protein [Terrimicrobiaceae bacterium]